MHLPDSVVNLHKRIRKNAGLERTYTHATRQMQRSAAEKMGSFMAQVKACFKQSIGAEVTSAPMLFQPFRTFRQAGQGVGQNLTHTLTHNVFGVFIAKSIENFGFRCFLELVV